MNDRKSERRRRKKNCTFLLCLLSIIFHMPRHIYTSIYIQLDTRITYIWNISIEIPTNAFQLNIFSYRFCFQIHIYKHNQQFNRCKNCSSLIIIIKKSNNNNSHFGWMYNIIIRAVPSIIDLIQTKFYSVQQFSFIIEINIQHLSHIIEKWEQQFFFGVKFSHNFSIKQRFLVNPNVNQCGQNGF